MHRDAARADPDLAERDDILAMLLQSRYEDGEAMSADDLADVIAAIPVSDDAEITVECNPDDVDEALLGLLTEAYVDEPN